MRQESYISPSSGSCCDFHKPIITDIVPSVIPTNSTTTVRVVGWDFQQSGDFLIDTLTPASAVNYLGKDGIGRDIWERDFTTTTSGVKRVIVSNSCGENDVNDTIEVAGIKSIVPVVSGNSPELWQNSGIANNGSSVGNGSFESEGNNGNGWNEHAYFGPVTAGQYIELEFTHDTPTWASAYCFIRLNADNTASTTGTPRVYIWNTTNMYIYDDGNAQSQVNTIVVGDVIKMRITATTFEVFKNGASIYSDTGTYNLANIYPNFTAYRGINLTNISLTWI